MVLSRTGMHAFRAVIFIARQEEGVPIGAAEIARRLDLPPNYLSKTLRRLAQRGVLRSTRGRTGGFELARPASEISVADVMDVTRGPVLSDECLLGGTCHPDTPCAAHARWSQWESQISGLLEGTHISEFLNGSAGVEPVGPPEILHLGADR